MGMEAVEISKSISFTSLEVVPLFDATGVLEGHTVKAITSQNEGPALLLLTSLQKEESHPSGLSKYQISCLAEESSFTARRVAQFSPVEQQTLEAQKEQEAIDDKRRQIAFEQQIGEKREQLENTATKKGEIQEQEGNIATKKGEIQEQAGNGAIQLGEKREQAALMEQQRLRVAR